MPSQKCVIHPSSVNHNRRENLAAESSAIIGEKALMAFVEKVSVGSTGADNGQPAQLRNTTRLDPMTYLLFGAYHLRSNHVGLICDDWLPMLGNPATLDEVQQLKHLLDGCMLRVFQGVGAALVKGRSEKLIKRGELKVVKKQTHHQIPADEREEDELEHEAGAEAEDTPVDLTLTQTEVIELDNLASDVVAILDRYAEDRGATASRAPTRPASPEKHHPMTAAPVAHGGAPVNPNAYVPPAARQGARGPAYGNGGPRRF